MPRAPNSGFHRAHTVLGLTGIDSPDAARSQGEVTPQWR